MMVHTHKVLVATDNQFFYSRITSTLASLPVTFSSCGVLDATRILSSREYDGVVLDAGAQTPEMLLLAERLVAAGRDFSVLAQIPLAALDNLRVPERLICDFFVEGASDTEIITRMRFLLWPKETPSTEERIIDGSLVVDLATYQVHQHGEPVDFAYLEYSLLAFMVTHPDRTHSRDELLRRVWGGQYYGGSRTVDVHIRRVRAKLDPDNAHRLETVRGVGYVWHSAEQGKA